MEIEAEPDVIEELKREAKKLDGATPQEILKWGIERYFPDITLACSFGGITGMALLDMTMKINPKVEVFYIDTDFLFKETYQLKDRVSKKYGFQPVAFKSRWTPEQQAKEFSPELWAKDPDMCCALRKVEPNQRALENKKAWISGLRRDQSSTRKNVEAVDWDAKFGLVKLNPLAFWTEAQVWQYLRDNDVPYNDLHERGYPSIGCTYCTRPVKAGEDARAGRWSGKDKIECGLHVAGGAAEQVALQVTTTKQ